MKKYHHVLMISLLWVSAAVAETVDADKLYQASLDASSLYKDDEAHKLVKAAADHGSARAMCEYAREKMESLYHYGDESTRYFKMAMAKKEPCGYQAFISGSNAIADALRKTALTPEQNKEFATILQHRIEAGDTRAMRTWALHVSGVDNDEKYRLLKQAAVLGDPWASYWYATEIQDGYANWYIIPGARVRDALSWFKLSAKQGNLNAIQSIYLIYAKDDNIEEAEAWLKKGIELGSEKALYRLGYEYTKLETTLGENLKKDEVMGYAYLYILLHQLPWEYDSPNVPEQDKLVKVDLKTIGNKLSETQRKEAIAWAENWMKTHQAHVWLENTY
jgi:TPR repeat protein